MEVKKTVSILFSIAFIGAFMWTGPVTAGERGLAFHGHMVNAGCDVQASSDPGQEALHLVGVSGQLTLNTIRNACGKKNLPLVARYVEQASTDTKARAGVLTLTYQ